MKNKVIQSKIEKSFKLIFCILLKVFKIESKEINLVQVYKKYIDGFMKC